MNIYVEPLTTFWTPPDMDFTLESDNEEAPVGDLCLELVELIRPNELTFHGSKLMDRATELGCLLGQSVAEALWKNQRSIPEDWTGPIIFPGTVYTFRTPVGTSYPAVSCLLKMRKEWQLTFTTLAGDFGDWETKRQCYLLRSV